MELVELGTIIKIEKGKKPVKQSPEAKEGYLPYVDIEAFESGTIKQYADGVKCTPCDDGDILIVCDGSRSGLVGKAIKGYVGSTLAKITAPKLKKEYLYYFVQGKYALLNTRKKGTGTPHLNQELLKKQKLIVPSFEEQERIVSRIEELFSQLDDAVETLKKTKDQLAVYRQAVLKEAFEKEFEHTEVSKICSVVRGGSPRPAGDKKYYDGHIPFLKVADLTNNDGMYLDSHTFTIKETGLKKTRQVPAGTLLLSNSGATLGVPKICTFETTFNDGIAAFVDFKKPAYLPFHYYFWLSKTAELRAINQGAAQPNLNTGIIGNVLFPLCDYDVQKEIANEIESRLSVCDSIEKTVEAALQQAEAMRQSILKSAFEGRL